MKQGRGWLQFTQIQWQDGGLHTTPVFSLQIYPSKTEVHVFMGETHFSLLE